MTDLEKRARLAEIDRLIPLNDRQCEEIGGEIEKLQRRHAALLKEREQLRLDQVTILRSLMPMEGR